MAENAKEGTFRFFLPSVRSDVCHPPTDHSFVAPFLAFSLDMMFRFTLREESGETVRGLPYIISRLGKSR